MAESVKKTTTAAKPRKAAPKKSGNGAGVNPVENHRAAQGSQVSHEEVARLAHSYWQQRGGKHGHHMEDWFRAEQELRARAS
jgi:hypothetical protein